MGELARGMSSNGQASRMNKRWEGTPIFVRPCFEGCFDTEEELLPRLKLTDLQDPETFHVRLAAFLMKQH